MEADYTVRRIAMQTGEVVPALIDRETGLPPILPMRWIMRQRRNEVAVNTMVNDLRGVGELYEWVRSDISNIEIPPDEFFRSSNRLSPRKLKALTDYVNRKRYKRGKVYKLRSYSTVALRIGCIEDFLKWAADPSARGSSSSLPSKEARAYRRRLETTLKPHRKNGTSNRPDPLTPEQDTLLRKLIGPVRDEEGYPLTPLRFSEDNPFHEYTRLRNWIVYLFLRELGMRAGEALKVNTSDLPRSAEGSIKVIRRRHDEDDTRSPRPRVKGQEGVCPASPLIMLGVSTYLSDTRHPGYRTKGSPYLFTNRNRKPLSRKSCNRIFETIKANHPEKFGQLSPHVLRHTWAEEVAHDLIGKGNDEESALAMLRSAGRWSRGSDQPLHYIQNALEAKASERLREHQRALYVV